MYKLKQGITLIALVITIVILMILVGATISMMVVDNGIIKNTTTSSAKANNSTMLENLELIVTGLQMKFVTNPEGKDVFIGENGYLTIEKINSELINRGINYRVSGNIGSANEISITEKDSDTVIWTCTIENDDNSGAKITQFTER